MSDMKTSELDRELRIEALLPALESDLFDEDSESSFWVGEVSDLDGPSVDLLTLKSVARLRANVYIDEKRFLGEESRNSDGTEMDEYDDRSIQFATFENLSGRLSRPISCGRMILKLSDEDSLPIEKYFPEIFENEPAVAGSAEISRFISRHPNKLTQHASSLAMIRAMVLKGVDIESPNYYFMIEKPLFSMLSNIGIPVEQLEEERHIPEQNGVLYPVGVRPTDIVDVATDKGVEASHGILQAFFSGEDVFRGQGYYQESLMRI